MADAIRLNLGELGTSIESTSSLCPSRCGGATSIGNTADEERAA
ncbi:hypothetical protein AB5I41_28480 [Sphingomonas sp. MMS24-JH45]